MRIWQVFYKRHHTLIALLAFTSKEAAEYYAKTNGYKDDMYYIEASPIFSEEQAKDTWKSQE